MPPKPGRLFTITSKAEDPRKLKKPARPEERTAARKLAGGRPSKIVKGVEEQVRAARSRADRILDRQSISPVKSVFEAEHYSLTKNLSKGLKRAAKTKLDPATMNQLSGAVTQHLNRAAPRLANAFAASTRETSVESIRGLANFVGKVRPGQNVLESEAAVQRILRGKIGPLDEARKQYIAQATAEAEHAVRQKLINLSFNPDATVKDAIDTIGDTMDDQWWRFERVVRTETSHAYNQAQHDGMAALAKEIPGLWQRWTEMVDDLSGRPLDNRVAADSMVLHGQVARPGEAFKMPGAPSVSSRLQGMSWYHPPNRPNDRAILTPWMKEWGVPGWTWRGRKVYFNR